MKFVARYTCDRCIHEVEVIKFGKFFNDVDPYLEPEKIIDAMSEKAIAYADDLVCPQCDLPRTTEYYYT